MIDKHDQKYAYHQGYYRGFNDKPIHGAWWPAECPVSGPMATQFKAGWVDGQWDLKNGQPEGTSLVDFQVIT